MSLRAISSFREAYRHIIEDKVSLVMALIPMLIGALILYYAGSSLFSALMGMGTQYIEQYLGDGTFGSVVTWLIKIILMILVYYLGGVIFVLLLSIIASPFNDIISKRVEKRILGQSLPSFSESVNGSLSNLLTTLLTEIKKIVVILGVTLIAVVMGFFPILTPLSFLLSAIVLSTEFIDFSWSRHQMSFKECRSEYRKNLFSYSFGGLFFMFLVSIPGVNILVPAYGTSYFTVLWVKSNEHRNQAS